MGGGMSSGRHSSLERWRLRGELDPALRRGAWAAIPVGACLVLQLTADDGVAGALATGALLAGLIAFEAPARVRARFQLLVAPVMGVAAAVGVLSSGSAVVAVVTMVVVAGLAGCCVAVSPRLTVAAAMCALSLLIAQGLYLGPDEAPDALLLATAGAALQGLWSLVAWAVFDRASEPLSFGRAARAGWLKLRAGLGPGSPSLRHALRFGAALGAGVAVYRLLDFRDHGYWVPLTILFVLRPGFDDTLERIAMRGLGTIAGLVAATALAELLGGQPVLIALVLTAAAALAFALLAIEYALFTTAITVYVVLLADGLGSPALDAVDERGLGTALGIAIAALSLLVLSERRPSAVLP
ncbi:MAG: hypothetical protein GEU88_10000 [Solirubrobacterales bacterium]|nr:hypothetical protein [Solirubrobacterales bacterium]